MLNKYFTVDRCCFPVSIFFIVTTGFVEETGIQVDKLGRLARDLENSIMIARPETVNSLRQQRRFLMTFVVL